MRVLIVDNEQDESRRSEFGLRERLGDALAVDHVTSLGQAIRALIEHTYDVVLLELALHDAHGMASLAGIRGAAPSIPIVAYTRDFDESIAMRALRAGAQECLPKQGTDAPALARTLQFAIERQRRLVAIEAARVEAAHRATHDPLTGLANRNLFLDQLDRALAFGARYNRKTGLLFVDLDGFKGINDVHGHSRGDTLLRVVAERLVECVRRSDAVARLGGDEFVVLLPDVTSRRDVSHVREMILECLREPIEVGSGQCVRVDASVGGAMSPLDGGTAHELLDAADSDMYRVKTAHRRERTPVVGVQSVLDAVTEMQSLGKSTSVTHRREARMRQAVRAGEFEVHYQPIIDVESDRMVSVEALLRWRDPDRGVLLPSAFLTLAEDTGLIVPIGDWVLREVCQQVVRWRQIPGAESARVGVNISAVQLRESAFSQRVEAILAETRCPADALVLELTENSMLVDGEIAIESLRELSARGTRLVVDDFGVGYASLTFVREAPVDGIKLDRRFVGHMTNDARDYAIVASIIRLAHGLKLGITAEGVESTDQAQRLQMLQCAHQQGRHYSDVVTASEIESMWRAPKSWVTRADGRETKTGYPSSRRAAGLFSPV